MLLVSLFIITLLGACSTIGIEKDDQLTVYTTVYPLHYFTERIGGTHVDVKSIYPADADIHTYKPTQQEIVALADADLFFYIGLGLESFIENAENTLVHEQVKMIATSEAISEEMLGGEHLEEDHEHDDANFDPYVWLSPILSDALAYSIKEALIKQAPHNKADFEDNFEELRNDLLKLDRNFINMVSNTPNKTFLVSPASFGYIAETYGLEQNLSPKLTESTPKEIGDESLTLHNLGVLTDDNVKNEENYFSLMNDNIRMLEKALGNQ